MKHCFSKMIILGIIAAWQLSAGPVTIAQDITPGGFLSPSWYFGETLQTPAGGPWNTLTFNFFSALSPTSGLPTTPAAAGTLYLLSSEYLGAPSDLSSSVPGYIASTSTVSGGVWDFASSLTAAANTQYWVYDTTALAIAGATTAGGYYYSDEFGDTFNGPVTSGDLNFNFSGTVVTTSGTPEPTTLLLMAPALLLVLRRRLTR
jgi:hypothetical protein